MGPSSGQVVLRDIPFFSSGFRTTALRQGELEGQDHAPLKQMELWGRVKALSFSINCPGVKSIWKVPSL